MPNRPTPLGVGLAALALAGTVAAANTLFLGNAPISRMNAEDVDLLYAAVQTVLDSAADGAAQHWENPKTGAGGTLTPVRSYAGRTGPCRDLLIENHAGGIGGRTTLTLCKSAQGEWSLAGD